MPGTEIYHCWRFPVTRPKPKPTLHGASSTSAKARLGRSTRVLKPTILDETCLQHHRVTVQLSETASNESANGTRTQSAASHSRCPRSPARWSWGATRTPTCRRRSSRRETGEAETRSCSLASSSSGTSCCSSERLATHHALFTSPRRRKEQVAWIRRRTCSVRSPLRLRVNVNTHHLHPVWQPRSPPCTRLKTPRRIRPANVEPSQVTWQSSMGRLLPRAPEMTLHDHLLVSADGHSRCVPVTLKRTRRPASPTGHAVPPVRQRDDRRPNQERRRWPKSVGYGWRPPGLRDPWPPLRTPRRDTSPSPLRSSARTCPHERNRRQPPIPQKQPRCTSWRSFRHYCILVFFTVKADT